MERARELCSGSARSNNRDRKVNAVALMVWVGLVNNCKARVEEIIFAELIYS